MPLIPGEASTIKSGTGYFHNENVKKFSDRRSTSGNSAAERVRLQMR